VGRQRVLLLVGLVALGCLNVTSRSRPVSGSISAPPASRSAAPSAAPWRRWSDGPPVVRGAGSSCGALTLPTFARVVVTFPLTRPPSAPHLTMPDSPPTLDVVAKAAGVSRMTVSRALSGRAGVSAALREKIQRLAKEVGYSPLRASRRLPGSQRSVIAVLSLDLTRPFQATFVSGVLGAARASGCRTLIYSLTDPKDSCEEVAALLAQVSNGVVCSAPHHHDYLAALGALRVPVVTIDNPGSFGPTIVCDNYNGACAAMRHLLELGHRRIAHIAGHEGSRTSLERRRAYEDVLRERGVRPDRALIVEGDNTLATAAALTQRLLALPEPPTAIFTYNDAGALGALEAARLAGLRVPADLSVVGFDDVPQAAHAAPPLTTVHQPVEQMGQSAVNTLLALLSGIQAVSSVITFPTSLVVRGSTGPPRKSARSAAGRERSRKRR
jgi:LacI family transcriptional regulator